MKNTPLIVTYAEAGKMLLGISESTVRRMVSVNRIGNNALLRTRYSILAGQVGR